jgi:hypothetical protein
MGAIYQKQTLVRLCSSRKMYCSSQILRIRRFIFSLDRIVAAKSSPGF